MSKKIININSKLISQYLFIINCLIYRKPRIGKSLVIFFINKILGENKCMSLYSDENSLTSTIVKYIHSYCL